ncbi:MAG TPA: glycosyltransferase [Terriglobia bacterium]|nr:glycosyltransferase [Terriglobia bacterium]
MVRNLHTDSALDRRASITGAVPVLTIFVPAYNSARYLAETLDSLLEQSFTDFELILVDDGSTDQTLAVAERYARADARIRVIRSPHRGEVAARNKALRAAHPASRFFLNHDSDDISLPGKLETLVRYLEDHPEVSIVGTLAEYFSDEDEELGQPPLEITPADIRRTFQDVNSMINSASMIRREVFETIGGYRDEFRSVDDYDFFMRALLAGFSLANIPEVLHRIRLHSASIGSQRAALQIRLSEKVRAIYASHGESGAPVILREPAQLSRSYRQGRQRRLRILHTVQTYHPQVGGSEEVIRQISERLVQRGHHVTVATGFHPDRSFSRLNGVEVRQFRVSGNRALGIEGEAEAYQQFVLNGDFDVIVNYAGQIWSSDLVFPLLDRIRAARVFVPCGYSALFAAPYNAYFEALPSILAKYDRVVHLSGNYRDARFSRKHGLTNSVVIGNGAAEEEFDRPSPSFRDKYGIHTPRLVITVANHFHGKGHNHLLRWFRELGRDDVTLAIIGARVEGGCWSECVQAAASLENVVFFDELPREDVVSALKDADLFWFGSDVECFPLVILEAMAAKAPWLSTNVGNVAELAGGWVAEPADMARKVHELLDSEALRSELGRQGHDEWKARYTWDRIVDDYERLYMSALRRPSAEIIGPPPAAARAPGRSSGNGSAQEALEAGLVSVVIPCYKQAQFLPEAVASVLEQSCRQFEIIIVDDGSPDDTAVVARRLADENPDQVIRLISHPNQGLAASRNAGIEAARGEFILPLDADDRIKPAFLETCLGMFASDPGLSIVGADLEEFGDSQRRIPCGNPALESIAVSNQINYCSLFRKSLWRQAGGYRANMRWGYEDWDFWITCLAGGARAAVAREPLFLYRKRGASMYSSALERDAELQAQIVLNHPGLYDDATEEWADALVRLGDNPQTGSPETLRAVLARRYVARARWREASAHLLELARRPGATLETRFLAGVAAIKTMDFAGARRTLRRFLDERPDDVAAHFLAALAAAAEGDLTSAREHAEDAVELDPTLTSAYETLIALGRSQGDEEIARDLAARCSELQIPLSPWIFSNSLPGARQTREWAELLYSKYLAFSPQPLLTLRAAGAAGGAPAPEPARHEVRVAAETRVSVIMPTFNRPELLAAAIDSVRKQKMQNFEILVVNDAGSDIDDVVSRRNKSRKITTIRHGRNLGLAAARNSGIRMARGEYIAYLDDDDLFYPDHLETLTRYLDANSAPVAYTDAARAHQSHGPEGWTVTHRDVPYSMDFDNDQILVGNFIPVLCVMHRRKCLETVGLFDESLTTHEDWDLWIRLSRQFAFTHLNRTTCEFSWRTDGSSMTSGKQRDFLRTIQAIYARTQEYAAGKRRVLEARARYLEQKKVLILGA